MTTFVKVVVVRTSELKASLLIGNKLRGLLRENLAQPPRRLSVQIKVGRIMIRQHVLGTILKKIMWVSYKLNRSSKDLTLYVLLLIE